MEKKDTRSRKWMITINNPAEKGYSHDRIKSELNDIKSLAYWCMCDEIGNKTHTYHTHIIIFRDGALRFSTLQKHFPPGSQLDMLRGTLQQARDYIRKEGKYKDTDKEETNLRDTFEESGMVPDEHQGQRNDLILLYDLIKDGMSNYQILEENPNYMNQLDKIDKCREIMRYEEFKNSIRDLQVEYWYGKTGSGKTRGILERYGFENVYRVTDMKNPWDGYRGQDVVLFEEFSGDIDITRMLIWLDIYPLELPCRYSNKVACYTKVFLTSNRPLDQLYTYVQREDREVWNAFLRRISCVKVFDEKGIIDYKNMDEYMLRFRSVPRGVYTPFDTVAEQQNFMELMGDNQ